MPISTTRPIERRHFNHQLTVDDVLAMLEGVPDGSEVRVRKGMKRNSAIWAASRWRTRLGVDFYVRVLDLDDGTSEVYVRRRMPDEPQVRGRHVLHGPNWMTLDEAADRLDITVSWLLTRHCRQGEVQRYKFGQRVLVKTAEVDKVAKIYARRPGGVIVNGPRTDGGRLTMDDESVI